jgi:outer membrane protein assembly factor BamB
MRLIVRSPRRKCAWRKKDMGNDVGRQAESVSRSQIVRLNSAFLEQVRKHGGLAFVATEPEGLLCIEAGPKIRWQKPLTKGPLAGAPLVLADGDLLVVYQAGNVCRVSADTGDELAEVNVAQPLGAAVRVLGQHVFLSGSDGVVHRVTLPLRP